MKIQHYIFGILCIGLSWSCAPATQQSSSGSSNNANARIGQEASPEAQAQLKTQSMRESLSLTAEQVDKVLVINTVNLKTVKYLKDNKETDKLDAAQKTYMTELEKVLTKEQFEAYKVQIGN